MSYETVDNHQPLCDPSLTSQGRVGIYFEQLRGEIITILHNDNNSQETIRRLENELSVYKRAYADLDAERHRFEKLKQESDKQKEDLENQLKGHRVVALLDGDGAIFNSQLISQGQAGGHAAAQKLSDSIIQYLVASHGTNQYQLWVYVFLNKRGLGDTFGRVGLVSAKAKFEEFVVGFNQAAERFIMVDVGGAKEAADAKIKALLEEEIRLPQTQKIIFGGCHDNGYATTLRSQITAGFKHKLILLPGYSDIAMGINELDLPSFSVPELFIPQKLAVNPSPTQPIHSFPLPTATQLSPPQILPDAHTFKPTPSIIQQAFEALPFATVEPPEMPTPKEHPLRLSYSSAVQRLPKRPDTPELDSSGSTISSDDSDESVLVPRPSVTSTKLRRVIPNIPLSKHKPPPCTLYYLSNCKHGAECKYAHDYQLEPAHFNEIRVNARKSPCPARNKGEICLWGDDCCYGHHCPLTTKCHFFKQNRCKFVGAGMHKEPKEQPTDMA